MSPFHSVSEPKPDVDLSQQIQSVNVGAVAVPAPAEAPAAEEQAAPVEQVQETGAPVAVEGF